ncbi:MAG TPA: glycosyltransferase family 4 protein [Chitinophagaceae bacterium]|nr:glycosyltransferase family 4 protein [Chitinophagaceae bacterium]
MKILQIMNRIPYPLNDGGSLGIHYYMKGYLDAGVQLSVLAMNTSRDYVPINNLPPIYKKLDHFEVIDINTDIHWWAALKNILFEKTSYNVQRFNQEKVHTKLKALLKKEKFDIIHLDSLFVTDYITTIRKYSKAKIVLRQHNIEYTIWNRLAKSSNSFWKRKYYEFLTKRIKNHEIRFKDAYDLVLTISATDTKLFQELNPKSPILEHPFGIDIKNIDDNTAIIEKDKEIKIYHIGAMDWLPNQESVKYLLEEIAPTVLKKMHNISFHIAGRNMNQEWYKYANDNIHIYGEVPDAKEFELDKNVLIVPLKSGGGVRIKIFQALAQGKLVLTSPVGIEGIEAKDKKEILLANAIEDYVEAIDFIKNNPQLANKIAKNGQELIQKNYDADKNMMLLLRYYKEHLL